MHCSNGRSAICPSHHAVNVLELVLPVADIVTRLHLHFGIKVRTSFVGLDPWMAIQSAMSRQIAMTYPLLK